MHRNIEALPRLDPRPAKKWHNSSAQQEHNVVKGGYHYMLGVRLLFLAILLAASAFGNFEDEGVGESEAQCNTNHEGKEASTMPYEAALKEAMQGLTRDSIIWSMRAELSRALKLEPSSHLINVKTNLAVALMNFANGMEGNFVGYTNIYRESEGLLQSVLKLDPSNAVARSNLLTVQKNLELREFHAFKEVRLYNPHMTVIARDFCRQLLLRRLNAQLLSCTLFTCDNQTDRGLIWTLETQGVEVEEVQTKFWAGKTLRVHHFQVYDARSLVWKRDLCWISSGGGWTKGPIFMLFHCVPIDVLLAQMDRAMHAQELLPLLHSKGGAILTDRKEALVEKNWSPFVVGDVLYITYSIRPHIVMQCDWEPTRDVLKCETVQEEAAPSEVYEAVGRVQADLRGSSTALQLPLPDNEFLALGHLYSGSRRKKYEFFFYKFKGHSPPFHIVAISPLFKLPSIEGSQFQYAHGICVEPDGVIITYGVDDSTSWYLKVSLQRIQEMLAPRHGSQSNLAVSLEAIVPVELSSELFGRSLTKNLEKMESSLKCSSSDIASNTVQFLRSIPYVTLDECFAHFSHLRRLFLETSHAFEELETTCKNTTVGMGSAECLDAGELQARTDDAFRAYATVLSKENRIIQDVFDRTYANAHESSERPTFEVGSRIRAHHDTQERISSQQQDIPESKHSQPEPETNYLPYAEALQLAVLGRVNQEVIDAMRREHVKAEVSKAPALTDVKINLGVALMRWGNESPDPNSFLRMYKESEEILVSALALHPGHGTVAENLKALRRNIRLRTEEQSATPPVKEVPNSQRNEEPPAPANIKPPKMTYQDALQQAMRGQKFVNSQVVEAMQEEHSRALQLGNVGYLVQVKMNCGVALQNLANEVGARENVKYTKIYKESRNMLLSALKLEPTNQAILQNLDVVYKNILKRDEFILFNPHITKIGGSTCDLVVLRRLMQEQLSSTLFTCDNHTNKGLLWSFESEEVDEVKWMASFRDKRYFHRAPAHDVRSLVWKNDLCWISSGWDVNTIYMLFHCISLDSFWDQMEQSLQLQELLPLVRVRGGAILTDRKTLLEKNWSPFVVGDILYITYSAHPHIVKQCDWEPGKDLLMCKTVQVTPVTLPESLSKMKAELRGSSTALLLPTELPEYLAMGHIRGPNFPTEYMYYFYTFSGKSPPFQMEAFSTVFSLPSRNESKIQYGHGICIDSGQLIISYGVDDLTPWYVKVPLKNVLEMLAPDHISHKLGSNLLKDSPPLEFQPELFGRTVQENIDHLRSSLGKSKHLIAVDFLSFLKQTISESLEYYAAGVYKYTTGFRKACRALDQLERRCEADGLSLHSCASRDEVAAARDDARNAFLAYSTLLSWENRIIQDIVENQYFSNQEPKTSSAVSAAGSRVDAKPAEKAPANIISYAEATQLALKGKLSPPVVEAMRREHVQAEAVRSPSLLEVKLMLAVSLLRLGNSSPHMSSYAGLYQECEEVLMSALALHPGHPSVEENLNAVRANLRMRMDSEVNAS